MRNIIRNIRCARWIKCKLSDAIRIWRYQRLLRTMRLPLIQVAETDLMVFVILIPGAVHIGELALKYLQDCKSVSWIANGLSKWEIDTVRSLHSCNMIELAHTYQHSELIDSLTHFLHKPFWLIDHDCYVLDVRLLNECHRMLEGRVGVALYSTTNQLYGFNTPETFIMLLNPQVIRTIRQKYNVTSGVYNWDALPEFVRQRLATIGISHDRMPEAWKPYFDTLRIIAFLAQADGCGFDMSRGYSPTCQQYPDVIHIGGTSKPVWPPNDRYQALGSYFWKHCLESFQNQRGNDQYGANCSSLPDSKTMREHFQTSRFLLPDDSPALLDFLDGLAQKSV